MAEKRKNKSAGIAPDGNLRSLECRAVGSLEAALAEIKNLSDARLRAKMSISRLAGVARELRELINVLSSYGC